MMGIFHVVKLNMTQFLLDIPGVETSFNTLYKDWNGILWVIAAVFLIFALLKYASSKEQKKEEGKDAIARTCVAVAGICGAVPLVNWFISALSF